MPSTLEQISPDIYKISVSAFEGMGTYSVIVGAASKILSFLPSGISTLSANERRRAESFKFINDKEDYVAAHILARHVISLLTNESLDNVIISQPCAEDHKTYGKPTVVSHPELCVSWSHQSGLVCAGAAHFPIGVDIELVKQHAFDEDFVAAVLSSNELLQWQAILEKADVKNNASDLYLLTQWVRKEAMIKLGFASLDNMANLDFSQHPVRGNGDGNSTFSHNVNGAVWLDFLLPSLQAVGSIAAKVEVIKR